LDGEPAKEEKEESGKQALVNLLVQKCRQHLGGKKFIQVLAK